MASVTLSLDLIDPCADVLSIVDADGERKRFVSLHLGPDVTLIFSGFDDVAASQARDIASSLMKAVAIMKVPLPASEAVEVP